MADPAKHLQRLTASNARIAKLAEQRDGETRKRDELIRAAFADGASWAAIEATGVSRATVQKAKNGRGAQA